MKKNFSRKVSLGDLIFDRWETARFLGFGKGSSIYDSSLVLGDVKIGKDTWVGPHTVLDGSGGLTIGDNCSISTGVQIYSHDSVKQALNGKSFSIDHAATFIGSHVYIGPNTVVAKGIKIGNRVVIGAMSFVNKDIPDNSKAYGVPVKIVPLTDTDEK